jgi:hypothetical protein
MAGCTSACFSNDRGLSVRLLLMITRLPQIKINLNSSNFTFSASMHAIIIFSQADTIVQVRVRLFN